MDSEKRVLLAAPRGYCAGVDRAVITVEKALELYGAPVYVRKEIVHNKHVVSTLEQKGVIFVNETDEVPEGKTVIFSAHGVSPAVHEQAAARSLKTIDATCPLVTKVHLQAQRYSQRGYTIVVVGHAEHEEVEGTRGSVNGPVQVVGTLEEIAALPMSRDAPVAYVTQTTLSMNDTRELIAALEERYPDIVGPGLEDICYATMNRQRAVQQLARRVDLIIVVGAHNSSNSNRLQEVAADSGVPAWLVEDEREVQPIWLEGVGSVGLTAGASTPEYLVRRVSEKLTELGAASVRELPGLAETVRFRLPDSLSQAG